MHWMVCSVYYLGCLFFIINTLFAECNITDYWMTTFRYCCLGFFIGTHYLFSDIDAVTATFQVLANTYFLNFRLALLWFCLLIVLRTSCSSNIVTFNNLLVFNFPKISFSLDKYSLLIFDVVPHYQLNAFKIAKMV